MAGHHRGRPLRCRNSTEQPRSHEREGETGNGLVTALPDLAPWLSRGLALGRRGRVRLEFKLMLWGGKSPSAGPRRTFAVLQAVEMMRLVARIRLLAIDWLPRPTLPKPTNTPRTA